MYIPINKQLAIPTVRPVMFTNEYSLFFRICRHAIFNEVETIVIGKLKFVCDL
jgi:hypothetical protein